jgi:L-rhamnose mutarotase
MFTIGPKAFHVEEETEQDDELNLDVLNNNTDQQQEHQHYHVLHTSGKVPAGFLHYLTNSLSKQGHAVVLISEQE